MFFTSYLSIHELQKGPGKFPMGVLESPGKILDFLSVKEWEPCSKSDTFKVLIQICVAYWSNLVFTLWTIQCVFVCF